MPGWTKFYVAGEECPILLEPEYCPCSKVFTAVCTLPEVPEVMTAPFYVGNHGWQQDFWIGESSISRGQEAARVKLPDKRMTLMNAESPYNHLLFRNKRYIAKNSAFFHAPETGLYRFWLTAYYEAKLYMNP